MTRTLMVLAVIALAVTPAGAQRGAMNPLRQLPLTQEDFAMIGTAVNRLTEQERVGESAEWRNPDSGNGGSVTLLELFAEGGFDCRRVRHMVKIKGEADAKQMTFKTCRDTDGVWKLA
ncbi:MAG: RT0821/Lpp0805 family surface protein [Geminicoccaceae bacterium]|nr:RT0821/Lpp0805 family surface protein [Geminicoccaceae bacterium]